MFRKIVSNLAFSPALVGQLGFYAKRLRKEEATRRIGLIFVALALIVQSFAVFSPPESANAANADNIIYSGIRDKKDLLKIYDRGSDTAGRKDIRQIYTHFGITRADIVNAHMGSYNTGDFNGQLKSVGRSDWGVPYRHPVKVAGADTTIYTGGYINTQGKSWKMPALIGKRSVDGAWFAITLDCGNVVYVVPPPPIKKPTAVCSSLAITPISRTDVRLRAKADTTDGATISAYTYTIQDAAGDVVLKQRVADSTTTSSLKRTLPTDGSYTAKVSVATSLGEKTDADCIKNFTVSAEPRCVVNPEFVESSPECQPCPDDETLWYKDKNCTADFVLSKVVKNTTQSLDNAHNTTAKPGDQLQYTLSVKNTGNAPGSYTMTDTVADILEYATIVNIGDGKIVNESSASPAVIAWPAFDVDVNETVQKVIVVKVKNTVPVMATNLSNPQSYNCTVTNTFGNTLHVNIECPPEKAIEQMVTELPQTGAGENIIFSAIVVAVVIYFYARARQTATEVRLIRRDLNAGTI
ncbi:MAG TPA: hypothetical protein VFM68_02110 [Candidatus Saccharimonadales bacterium]|nr:hypothetical protein [Candidatus Saccharimonadales bacterium]